MMKTVLFAVVCLFATLFTSAQPCTPQGDQTTSGTNNVWIGYAYNETDLTTNYAGFVNEGNATSPNFYQDFGGENVDYVTNGCDVQTSTFSIRYKLNKTFTNGNYQFTVGGDDGYRLSLDGGLTWFIDKWFDQGYATTTRTITLNGTYDMVLEYYENGGGNVVSFNVQPVCIGTGDESVYGTNNSWIGYVYDGTNFDLYKGSVTVGDPMDASFDENFGGDNVTYNTNSCSIQTETFSVRYRLRKTFVNGSYTFIVAGDDGYRFSIDGGQNWQINNWNDHSYTSSSYNVVLNGTYDLVIEYYENAINNRISFTTLQQITLPITLEKFSAIGNNGNAELNWVVSQDSNPDYFDIEKSTDGISFNKIGSVRGVTAKTAYTYVDLSANQPKLYYRLKMVDLTGKTTYSKVVVIKADAANTSAMKVYPTVVNNGTVFIEAGVSLKQAVAILTDASGKVVRKENIGSVAKGEVASFSVSSGNTAKGIYFVQLMDSNERIAVKKIIIQ